MQAPHEAPHKAITEHATQLDAVHGVGVAAHATLGEQCSGRFSAPRKVTQSKWPESTHEAGAATPHWQYASSAAQEVSRRGVASGIASISAGMRAKGALGMAPRWALV